MRLISNLLFCLATVSTISLASPTQAAQQCKNEHSSEGSTTICVVTSQETPKTIEIIARTQSRSDKTISAIARPCGSDGKPTPSGALAIAFDVATRTDGATVKTARTDVREGTYSVEVIYTDSAHDHKWYKFDDVVVY